MINTLLTIACISASIIGFMILYKSLEKRFGLPLWFVRFRNSVDSMIVRTSVNSNLIFREALNEIKIALSRTPHLVIHLAYVMRDKLRVRFAHYIDEVKGRKSISQKNSNSEFLKAVKEYKDVNLGGQIE